MTEEAPDEMFDAVVHDEMEAIGNMLMVASKWGLETEVVWSFGNEMASNDGDVVAAAAAALYEWDL